MIEAIKVALRYNPTPNPRVGAVLVDKNNKIKKVAAHQNKGYDHAEYSLFKNSEVSPDDTLYVTLEPCFHDDTSPSCASTVIQTGIKSVVVGDIDKDKRTDGKGIDLLRQNDIEVIVEEGVNEFLNPGYKYSDKKPFLRSSFFCASISLMSIISRSLSIDASWERSSKGTPEGHLLGYALSGIKFIFLILSMSISIL